MNKRTTKLFGVARPLNVIVRMVLCLACLTAKADDVIWQIGTPDGSAAEFALAPDRYEDFVKRDFGYEDRFFVIEHSSPAQDFCYVLPGPKDRWAGTSPTAGERVHSANILFCLSRVSKSARAVLRISLVDAHPSGSLLKVQVGQRSQTFLLQGTSGNDAVMGRYDQTQGKTLEVPLAASDLRRGDNLISLTILEGAWVVFDAVTLEGAGLRLADSTTSKHLLKVKSARYDLAGHKTKKKASPTDYVDTSIGTGHSRWMIAPGPWMPFSMVKLSPDNQNQGWQAGYQPSIESVGCMSHIHEWTMAGLGMMPTNGPLQTNVGDEKDPDSGYRSRIDKSSERTPLGYYAVRLSDTDILLEATATTRCALQRYTFPKDRDGRVMVDLSIPAEYGYKIMDAEIRQVDEYRLEGYSHQLSPNVWSQDAHQEYTIHFVIEFNAPIMRSGYWMNDERFTGRHMKGEHLSKAGFYVEFDTKQQQSILARSAISYVSKENAALNLKEELTTPFGWDFERVVRHQRQTWNELLGRIEIETDDVKEKVRFYTNLYRTLCRNCFSDVNGDWVAPDEKVRRLADPEHDMALGCDAFWNTFWNLNQVWNLVYPEWSSRWVRSQLAMYDACGWLAKGPAGMEYVPVMVGEHEIPLMVSAWQMGIRDFDGHHALEAMVHQQTQAARHVDGGFAGNRDLEAYLTHHYVPCDKGRFSNTLEYAYDDWTVSQMAGSLGDTATEHAFAERATWWRNAINPANGYAHLRDSLGRFSADFDPFKSGANAQYVEGNAWQLSYFVPQDVDGLIGLMGRKAFVDRLEWGFVTSEPVRYNAPGDAYWDYTVVQGNQQSMHFAFLFNWAGRPDLTQRWTRSVLERYYGYGVWNAYLGDEDQGQMSAWFVMAAMGLFQTDGGCRKEPIYELASPLFPKITIHLGQRYGRGKDFVIEARNASADNLYIRKATLNGKPLTTFSFPAKALLKGGRLVLEMAAGTE